MVLISEHPVRTLKFFHALALEIPLFSPKWVEDCIKAGKLLFPTDDEKYLISCGKSIISDSNSPKDWSEEDLVEYKQSKPETMYPSPRSERLFYQTKFYINGSNNFIVSNF